MAAADLESLQLLLPLTREALGSDEMQDSAGNSLMHWAVLYTVGG